MTNPATVTKSIGLPADALAVMVFAPDSYREPPRQFYRDGSTRSRLPGLSHLDNFVIGPKVYASKFNATYQTFGTLTNPAAETKSIGLQADAQLAAFLLSVYKMHRDK